MSDSDGDESAPPDVQHGDEVSADQGAAGNADDGTPAAPTHPVWAAAAGRGGGAPKGSSGSMYAPISMMELELRGRGDLDGASSTASDRGGKSKRRGEKEKHRGSSKKRPRDYDDEDEEEDDDGASALGSEPDLAGAALVASARPRACHAARR